MNWQSTPKLNISGNSFYGQTAMLREMTKTKELHLTLQVSVNRLKIKAMMGQLERDLSILVCLERLQEESNVKENGNMTQVCKVLSK